MPRITSIISRQAMHGTNTQPLPMLPCVWCGEPTAIMAETPFRPDLGAVPLMLTCGAQIVYLYGLYKRGEALPLESRDGLARLMGLPARPLPIEQAEAYRP